MKHELVQARNATGMRLRGQNSMLCGYYRGFAMVTNLNSKARCYDVVVWATRSGADMSQEANQWLAAALPLLHRGQLQRPAAGGPNRH